MLAEKKKIKLLIGLIVLVVVLIAVLIIVHAVSASGKTEALPPVTPRPSAEVVVREKEVEKIVTVEKEITAEIVQDSLRDAGFLVTEEYYFTEVVSYSSIKKLWNIDLGITESSYLASYDGVVTAGVDLTKAQVEKDEEKNHAARRRDRKHRHRPGELRALFGKGGARQPAVGGGLQQLPDRIGTDRA